MLAVFLIASLTSSSETVSASFCLLLIESRVLIGPRISFISCPSGGAPGSRSLDWISLWYLLAISAISFESLVVPSESGDFRRLIVSRGFDSLNLFDQVLPMHSPSTASIAATFSLLRWCHWGQIPVFLVRTSREHCQEMHNLLRTS